MKLCIFQVFNALVFLKRIPSKIINKVNKITIITNKILEVIKYLGCFDHLQLKYRLGEAFFNCVSIGFISL